MNIHERIKKLLDDGKPVDSMALGRVGKILSVDDHPLFPVNIEGFYGNYRCCTTFLSGDKVDLKYDEEKYRWYVYNTDWEPILEQGRKSTRG